MKNLPHFSSLILICSHSHSDKILFHKTFGFLLQIVNIYEISWWLRDKESTCQWRRHGFDPWIGKIPWRKKWQPTLVFFPGDVHGQRSLVGYSSWGHKESDKTERLTHMKQCQGTVVLKSHGYSRWLKWMIFKCQMPNLNSQDHYCFCFSLKLILWKYLPCYKVLKILF